MPDQNNPVSPENTPENQPAMQTPPPAAGQQPPAYSAAQPVAQPTDVPDRSTMYIVLSVIEIVCVGWILGLIPLIFSIMYKSAYSAGNMIEAAAKEKNARISLIVILIVGIVLWICVIVATVMGALAVGTSGYSTYSA